jgi:hypothetical protein
MFRIRKITDPTAGANTTTVREVTRLLKERFPLIAPKEFDDLPKKLTDHLKARFRTELFVGEDAQDRLLGAAVVLYAPDLDFLFLDYLVVPMGRTGTGVGGALYQRLREEASRLATVGIFFECLPDDPALCGNAEFLRENI